ncbi:MAG: class I SAM-dependent methyltransferase [Salibacter sp.]|uniref:O-methyltransferase n=1 Tax=Salibacter sp. TaxID=2010995 RepID=UPI00287068E4|nr:class I SAM-dependent methyltransferase [Salibacter sp.]MDR9398447.1 class I SAM-dependent methyltransferase [Salibacter sp.]
MHTAIEFFKYLATAKTRHGIHSPFVYNFLEEVLYSQKEFYVFDELFEKRKQLRSDPSTIEVTDFGAGSRAGLTKTRSLSGIAKKGSPDKKFLKLLFKIAHYYDSKNILELGTSLGISTSFLASAHSKSKVVTIEGCPQTAKVAQQTFNDLKLRNIELIVGQFDEKLDSALTENQPFDLIYIDGNHREEATVRYFEQIEKHAAKEAIFVLDDIYWSAGMTRAWEKIKGHKNVSVTLDLFRMGVVFTGVKMPRYDYRFRF